VPQLTRNRRDQPHLLDRIVRAAEHHEVDIAVARESQPLNAPKLMEEFETQLRRNGLSDPLQMVPLLEDISTDEHLPLIARNHALRLLKKINKK